MDFPSLPGLLGLLEFPILLAVKRRTYLVFADHSVQIMECGNAGTQASASLSGGMRGLT